jgi:CPA1 family monovalent cation:H+ antiporter
LVDSNYENVSRARLQGMDAYYGNILSEFTETDLDLSGIGRLLALTRNDEANALACKHLEDEFGSSEVYQLCPRASGATNEKPSRIQLGRLLFGRDMTYDRLSEMLEAGAAIKKTSLTKKFTFNDFQERYQGNFVTLMAFQGQAITVATADNPLNPQPGWTLVSLVLDGEVEAVK